MKSYLVTLSPLEPYFFGGERGFGFGTVKGSLKQRYFISSLHTPSQTTLLGALRYAVLSANDALISDYSRGSADRERADILVGAESFDFSRENRFGVIGSIHPLFIIDGEDYLVPMPMNHKNGQSHYTPISMKPCPKGITLSTGTSYASDYVVKEGCGDGWLNLTDHSVMPLEYDPQKEKGLFQSVIRVGINAHRGEKPETRNDDESFFKKEYKFLRKGKFAFFADMEQEYARGLENGVAVFLGQSRSAFVLKAVRRENDLFTRISAALSEEAVNDFWYAPADCRIQQKYAGLMIAKTRLFRHLTTSADNRYYYRINKTEKLYRLLNAGAVFYGEKPLFATDKGAQVIGMNELVRITKGGR